VSNIGNKKAVGISIIAGNSHGSSASPRVHGVRVDTHIDLTLVSVNKALVARVALVQVVDEAVDRIFTGEEVKGREEVTAIKGVNKAIACCSKAGMSPHNICDSSGGTAKVAK
jgi:hypothetical protein